MFKKPIPDDALPLGRRSGQQPRRALLVLEERGPVRQPLGRVPHDVAEGLLGVDAEEVLQDVEEGDLLRGIHDLVARVFRDHDHFTDQF